MIEEEAAYQRHKTNTSMILLTLVIVGLLLTFWLPFTSVVIGTSIVLFFTSQFLYTRGREIRSTLYPYDKDTNEI